VERATGVLMLALQQPPEAVTKALNAAARRHHLPEHELAEAVDGDPGRASVIAVASHGAVGGVGDLLR
jgi:hypothetical protein